MKQLDQEKFKKDMDPIVTMVKKLATWGKENNVNIKAALENPYVVGTRRQFIKQQGEHIDQ